MYKRPIDAEYFEECVGYPPVHDDLERCNCEHAGELGHSDCGWDEEEDLPRFITNYSWGDTK